MEKYKIIDKINNGKYEAKLEYPKGKRHRYDTIIDEDKSVRWNREEIERINKESHEVRKKYRNSIYEGELSFKEDVASYLKNDSLNKAQATEIVKKAWMEDHSEGFLSVLDTAEELAEFVMEIINLA